MDATDHDARRDRLLAALADASDLLDGHGEHRWARWLATDRDRIERGDGYGLDHLLSAYGGMGSLTDVMFSPANGNAANTDEGTRATEELRRLTSAIHEDARALQRTLHRRLSSTLSADKPDQHLP